MAVVDSTSTQAEVRAALADNASWIVDNNIEKAKNYVVAADVWLSTWAFDKSVTGPSEMEFSKLNEGIQKRRAEAMAFLKSQGSTAIPSTAGNVIRLSIENFRD